MNSLRYSKMLLIMLIFAFVSAILVFNPTKANAFLPENELHYDVDLINDAIGVYDGSTYEPAVVFRSDILTNHIGEKINKIKIGIHDLESNTYPKEITIKIYGKGSDGAPGNLLYSAPYIIESPGWKEIPVDSNIVLDGEDIWIAYAINNDLYQYYAGASNTDFVPNVNYIYYNNTWALLSNYGLEYNWHIRLITEIDQTNPELLSFNINDGSTSTNSTEVVLKQTAQDETTPASLLKMRFSNDNENWSDWETIADEKNWTLTDGEGEKTVYIQIKDSAGNIIDGSSSITLDTTAPSFVEIGPKNLEDLFELDKDIEVTFNEALAQGQQFNMISLKDSSDEVVDSVFTISGSKLIINPVNDLNCNSLYKLFIPANALNDLAGNSLNEDLNFDIPTIILDLEAPIIEDFNINEDTDTITITFSETVKSTDKINTITIKDGNGNILPYTPSISDKKLILTMTKKPTAGATYTVTIPADSITDLADNQLEQEYSKTFIYKKVENPKTGAAAPLGYMILAIASFIIFKKNKF